MKNVQVVIPYYNGAKHLPRLLSTLHPSLDVLVIDDHSQEPVPKITRPKTKVVRIPKKGYWAGACNYAASISPGRDLLFLNQDVHFQGNGWIAQLKKTLARGVSITGHWVTKNARWPKGYVDGVFMYVQREWWDKVGGMDARNYPLWGSSCLLQAEICRAGGRAAPLGGLTKHWLVHHRHGKFGDGIRQVLREHVGHTRNDGNIFRRVPPAVVVVIIAHGDYHKYLPRAVESIFAQTRRDWQLVIALDGTASPELRKQAKGYADLWKGIRYVQLPKGRHGPPVVRNAGVQAVKMRWFVLMMDGDDWAEPQAMELMLKAARQHPNHFVYGDLRFVGDRSGIRRFPEYSYPKLLERNYIPSFIMYPRAAFDDVGGYPGFMKPGWDDYGFNIALGRAGWCGVHLPEVVFNYRRHGHSRNVESVKKRSLLRELLREHFPDVMNRRYPMGCCGSGSGSGNPGHSKKRSTPRRSPPPQGVGKEGMIELRYIGNLGAPFRMRGPKTGVLYKGIKRGWRGWVDARDALALVGTQRSPGISREYDYTGRYNPQVSPQARKQITKPAKKPAPAPVVVPATAPPARPEPKRKRPTAAVATPAPVAPVFVPAEPAPLEVVEEVAPLPPGLYCEHCSKGPYDTHRGLEMHVKRFCKEKP